MLKFKNRLTAAVVLALTCLANASARAAAPVTYVSGKGTDTGDCSSPAKACRTFQFAVDRNDLRTLSCGRPCATATHQNRSGAELAWRISSFAMLNQICTAFRIHLRA
jgi:hypothetical protein